MEVIEEHTEFSKIQCCLCGVTFSSGQGRASNMCIQCLTQQQNILRLVTREGVLNFCRHCKRYLGATWQNMGRESKELLSLCLKKIRGLKELTIVEAGFVWTEEHCRRVKVRLTVRKEVQKDVNVQDSCIVEFREYYQQCMDCKKEFTPHQWSASVQVRQRSGLKKTLLFLEQMILKLGAHEKCCNIEQSEDGLDFFFKTRTQGQSLLDFIQAQVPCKVRNSKQLISADLSNNTYNYKYVWVVDLPKINRYDLVVIDEQMRKELGGGSRYLICSRVTKFIYLLDNSGVSGKRIELDAEQYFNYEEKGHIQEYIPFRGNHSEFMVIDVDYDTNNKSKGGSQNMSSSKQPELSSMSRHFLSLKKSAHIEVQRTSDWESFSIRSHLGEILKTGHIVLGFDLTTMANLNDQQGDIHPGKRVDIVLVMRQKNTNRHKRIYKLKRMEGCEAEKDTMLSKKKLDKLQKNQENDMEELMMELDRDPEQRKKVNLYKDQQAIDKVKKDRKNKYSNKQNLNDKIEELKAIQQKERGRKPVKVVKALGTVKESNNENTSDQEWVDCNTDEEGEGKEQVKLTELLDDLKLSDDEKEVEKMKDEQDKIMKENEENVDQFISQMSQLTIHPK